MSGLFHVTAKDHSALILMSELARCYAAETHLSLQEIAKTMDLSVGYLEEIASELRRAKLIEGRKGPGGGYRLARPPKKITLEQIVMALGGPITLVDCQAAGSACPLSSRCASKRVWHVLQKTIADALKRTSLEQVI